VEVFSQEYESNIWVDPDSGDVTTQQDILVVDTVFGTDIEYT
jgi:hypothetical protein